MPRRIFEKNLNNPTIHNSHFLEINYYGACNRFDFSKWNTVNIFGNEIHLENDQINDLISDLNVIGNFEVQSRAYDEFGIVTLILKDKNKNLIAYIAGRRLLNIFSENELDLKVVNDIIKKYAPKKEKCIYVIAHSADGLELTYAGQVNQPLIKDNYPVHIQNKIEKSIKWMQDKNPFGRIMIMSGAPGTGKSYALRSLITQTQDIQWIFVPSNIAGQLADPGFITTLLSERSMSRSVGLIIEDGDNLLRKRTASNEDVVSQILNLGDGLISDLIDLKMIITTNKNRSELDEAFRPGRLHDVIEFVPLNGKEANKIYKRLTEKGGYYSESFDDIRNITLAQVYEDALRKEEDKLKRPALEEHGQYV